MGEHFFGLIRRGSAAKFFALKRSAKALDAIAQSHDADFVGPISLPDNDLIGWFSCPNQGAPFDDATRDAVYADIRSAGYAWIFE